MPPPIAERLKIRCYRCNQLLAVAPNKAGTVVACPKCKADLLIPRPSTPGEEPTDPSVVGLKSETFPALAPATESPPSGREGPASPTYLEEIAALIPPEVASLRPEDLRVEAEVFEAIARQPSPPPPASDPFPFPASLTAADFSPPPAVEPPPAPTPELPAFVAATALPPSASVVVQAPPPLPIATTASDPVVVPPIRLEPDPIRAASDAEPRTIREVVLPASVVVAWSLFVLSAIPMAFLAGLMIGHFLWRAGP